jgi:sortase A
MTGLGSALRRVSNFCLFAGAALLIVYGFVWAEARFFQAYANMQFSSVTKALAKNENVPGEPALRGNHAYRSPSNLPDGMIGKLEIQRLGISVIVLQGVDDRTLRIAAGHVPHTALPGQEGNVGIAGHRDTFFRPLRNVHPDDIITLTTTQGLYRYRVQSISIVQPDRIDVLNPTPVPTLTLVTCYPFYYVGAAPLRYIVRAREIDSENQAVPVSISKAPRTAASEMSGHRIRNISTQPHGPTVLQDVCHTTCPETGAA